jgi:hypothetical protein
MKFLCTFVLAIVIMGSAGCGKKPARELTNGDCLTGKLVVKGPCLQYVIEIVQGDTPQGKVAAEWKDPFDNKTYRNVFTVENSCDFPGDVAVGEKFRFTWTKAGSNNCMRCEAYRDTPAENAAIRLCKKD